MTYLKCIDCEQKYDSRLDACPHCGCPTSAQTTSTEQTSRQTDSKKNNKGGKRLVLWLLPIIFGGIVAVGVVYYLGHSYEFKIARYEKNAIKYKASLNENYCILSEIIDSITQKVILYEKETEKSGVFGTPIKDIMVHDYATEETNSVLPTTAKVEDFELCGIEFRDSKQIGDRFFFIIHSNCMWHYGATGIFYVNVRDNTLHYVESCNNAEFLENGEISILKFYYLGKGEYGEEETERDQYTLSTSLSDEGYADNRREQKETEDWLAEKWTEQEYEREYYEEVNAWLVGTWESDGYDEQIGRYTAYVCITENNLRYGYNGREIYNGPYVMGVESLIFNIHDGGYSQIGFNSQTKRLEIGAEVFKKVSSRSDTHQSRSNKSSSYASSSGNSIAEQLTRLDNEEAQIISVVDPIRRSGQFYPDILVKVMRMKQINDERIRLARQQGDRDLIQYYELQKMRSEAIIRQWGF